jgi:hypothetical protein
MVSNPRRSRPIAEAEVSGADVVIDDVHADGVSEYVTVINRGSMDQPLTDWALVSLHGIDVYLFPPGLVLSAGGSVRVVSGEVAESTAPGDLVWMRQSIWSNRSDTALLFDNLGHEVTRFTYPRATIRENRKPKLKILIREIDGFHLYDWDEVTTPRGQQTLGG